MFSHGDGSTGQPGRVENDRREYREYRKFRYVSPCDAMPLEDDLAGTSGVAEIAENKFYVAWSTQRVRNAILILRQIRPRRSVIRGRRPAFL